MHHGTGSGLEERELWVTEEKNNWPLLCPVLFQAKGDSFCNRGCNENKKFSVEGQRS